jgi:hypothetical protein
MNTFKLKENKKNLVFFKFLFEILFIIVIIIFHDLFLRKAEYKN